MLVKITTPLIQRVCGGGFSPFYIIGITTAPEQKHRPLLEPNNINTNKLRYYQVSYINYMHICQVT